MSQKIQFRRGTTAEKDGIVFDQGEPIWVIDQQKVYIGDGATPGGVLFNVENPVYMSGSIANAVYTTGTQIISGVKNFYGLISGGPNVFGNSYVIDVRNGYISSNGTGANNILLDFERNLSFNGVAVLNWEYSQLYASNSVTTLDWNLRRLYSGENVLDWGVKNLTGSKPWNANKFNVHDALNVKVGNKSFVFTGVEPSYSNYLGTGQRSGLIAITTNISVNGNITGIINGNTTENVFYFNGPLSGSGSFLTFDFNTPKVITEAKYYQETTSTEPFVSWYGSNDNRTLARLTPDFMLGGIQTQTHSLLSGNTNGYRYYILSGKSGEFSSTPYIREMEFKIADELNSNYLIGNGKIHAGYAPNTYPTAYLHLLSGDTGVLSAPMKFTSGKLMTYPERGAIEYNNNNLFFTDETYSRKAFTVVAATPSAFNSPGISGNIAFGGGFAYFCTGNNAWGRVAISSW